MRHTSNNIGNHKPNGGEGLTAQDLYELLRILTRTERRNSYVMVGGIDVIGMGVSQSDQAEYGEVKVHLLLDGDAQEKLL